MSDYSTIDTKYGMIRISITDGDHIFISAADAVTFWAFAIASVFTLSDTRTAGRSSVMATDGRGGTA